MDLAQDVEQRNRSGHESADAVIATSSGFAVVGTTNSRPAGVHKAWVLEFDGVELRPRRDAVFGAGLGVRPTYARAVTVAADGGLRVAGEVEVEQGRFRPWMLSLAADGTVRWERTLGTTGINGLTALLSWNGDVLGGGVIDGAGWLVRMSEAGELLGERRLPQLERVTAMAALPGGGFAVAGIAHTSTTGPGASAVLTFEADDRREPGTDGGHPDSSAGEPGARSPRGTERPGWEWRPQADQQGDLFAVAATSDGGVVATGRIRSSGSPDWGLWLVRLDARGRLLWEHRPTEATVEAGYAIVALPDGDFVVAGDSLKDLSDRDARLWCFASDGALRWHRSYGGEAQDLARGIARLGDGSLLVAGSTMSRGAGKTDLWVLRLSASGEVVAQQTFDGP
jgi:outer membrane protein assembly factor BamB